MIRPIDFRAFEGYRANSRDYHDHGKDYVAIQQNTNFENIAFAGVAIRIKLRNGKWHHQFEATKICKEYHIGLEALYKESCISVSDTGRYICIQQDCTPDYAPDEDE